MFEFVDLKYKDIIDIPSLLIEEGKITTFIGQSGGGKTTILRLLNKMISPSDGMILYKGNNLEHINSVTHRREVTMLSQSPIVFDGNIRDNLLVGFEFQERQIPSDDKLIEVLRSVSLSKSLDDMVTHLSGGEKQRLALARVLLLDSKVYLLDEPSSSLDESTEELIIKMFTQFVKDNKTLIMVTHSRDIANKYSDVIINIANGTCV
ncbi:MAG: ATP-binding cassette domain-containing protein [Vallitalea sp.]|nr:ATP-binding cassette domain-containing protein [Vallitalea sp.]